VLPQYLPARHRADRSDERRKVYPMICIDPRMKESGIIMRELEKVEYPPHKFDFIVSIATIFLALREHTDIRNVTQRRNIVTHYISRLRSSLGARGVLLITLPWEHDPTHTAETGDSDALIQYYLEAFYSDDQSYADEAPNVMWKLNRTGMGIAGNNWREGDLLKSPNLPPDIEEHTQIAKTVYFLLWGATEIW
jgi:hypothetical protein